MWFEFFLHFEETSNSQLDSFPLVHFCRSPSIFKFLLKWDLKSMPPSGSVLFWCQVQVMPILLGRIWTTRRIVPVCRTNKDHSPPMVQVGIVNPIFKFEFGQPEPNPIVMVLDHDLVCGLCRSRSIYSPLTSVFLMCENHFGYCYSRQCFSLCSYDSVSCRGGEFGSAASIWCQCDCKYGCKCYWRFSRGERKSIKIQQKWKKAKPKTQNLYWSDGFVYDLGSFGLTQNKTKMGKKIKKRLENHGKELVWGKHKNVKNQLQKNQKTRGKFGKEKQKEDRCVREWRFGGSFIRFDGKETSSCSSSSRTWFCVDYFNCYHHHHQLFVPSTLFDFIRRMNLSSILFRWNSPHTSWGGKLVFEFISCL